MSNHILRCSLEDLAKLYSLDLSKFEPVPLVVLGQAMSSTFNLKDLYNEATGKVAEVANTGGCSYVGCYSFTFLPLSSGYIAEAVGLKQKDKIK